VVIPVVAAIVGNSSVPELFASRVSEVVGDEARVERRVIDHLLASPGDLLFGLGPGNYNFVVREMDTRLIGLHGVDPLDSGLLTVMVDFGVVGTIGFLVPVGRRVLRALRSSRQSEEKAVRGRLLLAAALSVVAMVQLPVVGALPFLLMFTGLAEGMSDVAGSRMRKGAVEMIGGSSVQALAISRWRSGKSRDSWH
jgi:hypothetical protein